MKKKLLYISIITIVFAVPIMYWLASRWGVTIGPRGLSKIGMAFASDRFLLFATMANISFYAFALAWVAKMDFDGKPAESPTAAAPLPFMPAGMRTVPAAGGRIDPRDPKWQNAYSGARAAPPASAPNPTPPAAPTSTPSADEKAPAKPTPAPQPVPASPEQKSSEADVLNLAEDTMKDVYKAKIGDLLINKGYENLGEASIDGVDVDFVGIADSDTLVLGILNMRYGDIIANETPTNPSVPPSWFTNEKKYNSPVWEAKAAVASVEKMVGEVLPGDSGISVKGIVVIPNASVVNKIDIEKKWEEQDIAVTKFLNYSDLPELDMAIPDKTGTEVLPSYRKFAETLMRYFNQKAKSKPTRKAG